METPVSVDMLVPAHVVAVTDEVDELVLAEVAKEPDELDELATVERLAELATDEALDALTPPVGPLEDVSRPEVDEASDPPAPPELCTTSIDPPHATDAIPISTVPRTS
jgi:hypothetical protein